MNDRNTSERSDRLTASAVLASKIGPLLADPTVAKAFDSIQRALIEEVINSPTAEMRDRAAAEIKAWRAIFVTLRNITASGGYAEKKLQQRSKDNADE